MSENITTAVDSLVKLVNDKGRVSLDDASKELGIPINILNEWANFLEQEKIIHIEYKFTTPYLTKTKQTKKETEDKDEGNKETIDLVIRRLDVTLKFIIKSNPKTTKQLKQKDFLMRKINELIELAKKGTVNKEELEKIVKYYKVYKKGL